MDQADEDDYTLNFAVPVESTNIYFDGWVMLKAGIEQDPAKQQAAEAFINFCSRPDNVIRNMYYIGYTSVITGGEDDTRVFEYADWCYGAEEDEEETLDYPLGYFFVDDNENEDYILTVPAEQADRQLAAQYPAEDVLERSSIMVYFDASVSESINQMWINVRCFNIKKVPVWAWILAAAALSGIAAFLYKNRKRTYKL
jgi:spermidine/putrescine transport system substrate-binding protein